MAIQRIAQYVVFGSQSDTKPTTDIPSNTLFFEIDTGNVYKFVGGLWSFFSGPNKTETFTNKTLISPTITSLNNSGVVTIPTGTRTLVARDTFDTLTNKTFNISSNSVTATSQAVGDILKNTGSQFSRLARGANGQVLTSTASDIQWSDVSVPTIINPITTAVLNTGQFKYNIFKDGTTWYCRNTETGIMEVFNSNPTTVLQYAITNALGYGIKITANDVILTTAPLNCVDKYFFLQGETYGTSGAAAASGATVIRANWTGATGDAVFNCVNTGYTKQFIKNVTIDCDNKVDYGINAFGVRECEGWLDNVSIIQQKKSGIKMQACWMSSWYSPNIVSASGTSTVAGSIGVEMVRGASPACNTIRVYGGRIANNDINVSLDATNDIVFFGTALEGAGVSAIKTFNGANANKFYGCSTEYGKLSSITVIDEAGNANVYNGLRLDAAHTAYNIITVRAACRNLVFENNLIQANASSTTATIIIEAGAINIDFTNNKQLTNTPLTVTVTDNQPSETQFIGNSFIQDKLRSGIQFGGNKLWLKELDANTLNLTDSGGSTLKNFRANAANVSTVRTTGAIDMVTFPDSSTVSLNSRNVTNANINATNNTLTDTSTSLGDLLKSNGTKFVRLGRGTSNQVLATNSGATDIAWTSLNAERTGTAQASGNGSGVTFLVPHGLGSIPFSCFIECYSLSTAFTYTFDATNISVTFVTAPPSGTNNVKFNWRAVA